MPFDQSPAVATRRDSFVYDTELACHTVVMACERWAEDDERILTFFHAIQHTFYSEGRGTTQTGMLCNVALANGIEAERFDIVFDTDVLRDKTCEDFRLLRRWDITGFPSSLAEQGGTLYQIGRGYTPSVTLYTQAMEVLRQHPTPNAD